MALNQGSTRDVAELKFIELRKTQVARNVDEHVKTGIAFSEPFSLLFCVPSPARVEVIHEDSLFNYEWSKSVINQVVPATPLTAFNVAFKPTFLSVSLTGKILACCGVGQQGIWHVSFYDVQAIATTRTASPFAHVSGSPGMRNFLSLEWHPEFADSLLVAALEDGSVISIGVNITNKTATKLSEVINGNPKVTSVSWSPKGKQIIFGKANGCVTFYKHNNGVNFVEARNIAPPDDLKGYSVCAIKWILSSIVLVTYAKEDSSPDTRYVVISAPPKSMPEYFDFGPICFDVGEFAGLSSYMTTFNQIANNVVLCTSSHCSEISVLGCDDLSQSSLPSSWKQFTLEDDGRVEIAMTEDGQDAFPRGLCWGQATRKVMKVSEAEKYGGPKTPCIFILTTSGIICTYYVSYPDGLDGVPQQKLEQLPFEAGHQQKPPIPTSQSEAPPSLENLTFCPPTHSTPRPAGNVFGLKPATFGAPNTSTPAKPTSSSGGGFLKPATFGGGIALGSAITSSSGTFGSSGSTTPLSFSAFGASLPESEKPSLSTTQSSSAFTQIRGSPQQQAVSPRESRPSSVPPKESFETREKESPEKDINLEAVLEEIEAMNKTIQEHKMKMKSMTSARIDVKGFASQILSEERKIAQSLKEIDESIKELKLDNESLTGWILDDHASILEAKSRLDKSKDPKFLSIVSNCPLDVVTERKFRNIVEKNQQIQDQLDSLNSSLNEDWRNRVQPSSPTTRKKKLEAIKSVLDRNSDIIYQLREDVSKIESILGIK